MEREKKYDRMYEVDSIVLKPIKADYLAINYLIPELQRLKFLGATHVEINDDIEDHCLNELNLDPLKERDETDKELQYRINRAKEKEEAHNEYKRLERMRELKQLN